MCVAIWSCGRLSHLPYLDALVLDDDALELRSAHRVASSLASARQ